MRIEGGSLEGGRHYLLPVCHWRGRHHAALLQLTSSISPSNPLATLHWYNFYQSLLETVHNQPCELQDASETDDHYHQRLPRERGHGAVWWYGRYGRRVQWQTWKVARKKQRIKRRYLLFLAIFLLSLFIYNTHPRFWYPAMLYPYKLLLLGTSVVSTV